MMGERRITPGFGRRSEGGGPLGAEQQLFGVRKLAPAPLLWARARAGWRTTARLGLLQLNSSVPLRRKSVPLQVLCR